MSGTRQTAAGWYPAESGIERYWNGAGWTGAARVALAGAPSASPMVPARRRGNSVGLIAFIAAILGFVLSCIPGVLIAGWILLPVGFILGIVGAVLSGRSKWAGISAIVISVVGTIVAFVVFFAVVGNAFSTSFGDLGEGSGSGSSGSDGGTSIAEDTAGDTSVPPGFDDTGAGIAIRFKDNPDCSISSATCSQIEVVALQDCPSMVYVEANVLNSSGTVIGFTNDTLGQLMAGDRGEMELLTFDEGAARVELTDINCY